MDRLLLMHSFVTVAQVGSFSGAAKKLGSSGSLVSRHVAEPNSPRAFSTKSTPRTPESRSCTTVPKAH